MRLAAPEPVVLDYRGARGLDDLLGNLSGVAADGEALWTVSDEGRSLERLIQDGDGYVLDEQLLLDDLFPDLPPGKEADLEAVEVADDRVWVCGSHCRVRREPAEDGRLNAGFRRRPSRHLLGSVSLRRGRTARALPFRGEGSLRRRLRADPFLSAYMNLPSKENGLDVEGLAIDGRRLMIGLRGPVLDGFAVVMEFTLDRSGRLAEDPPVRHVLGLDGLGVRDLARIDRGLLVLAGPVTAADGPFRVHLWRPRRSNAPQGAVAVHRWPLPEIGRAEHPEALCGLARGGHPGMLVLYDSPDCARVTDGRYRADWFPLPEVGST